MDRYHFFIPYRLVYDNFEKVFGNPNPSAYTDNELEEIPMGYGSVYAGSIGDYLGLPIGAVPQNNPVSVLPFRAFALIYDKYFRNENTTDEIYIQKKGFSLSELFGNNDFGPNSYCGKLPKVNKYKDYFTSCVPTPQKGAPVGFNLGTYAPVVPRNQQIDPLTVNDPPVSLSTYTGSNFGSVILGVSGNSSLYTVSTPAATNFGASVYPSNLYADLTDTSAITVDDLRLAFAYQKMLERDAIYGSRYNEYLYGHFGVHIPDAYIQFPQYLGGGRTPLNIVQVAQTSQGTEESPLGNVGAYSWTNGRTGFSRKFNEHC